MGSLKTTIVRIGNSQGVRIPKALVEQCGLHDELELVPYSDRLVIRPLSSPRSGWDEKFEEMARRGDDRLLDGDVTGVSEWDDEEWEWS